MDKYERRRMRVQELIKLSFDETQSRFAEAIGRDANYVSRMLYPPGKSGRKRIAEAMKDHIERSCRLTPGWLDMDLGTPVILDGAEVAPEEKRLYGWPFESITPEHWEALTLTERELVEKLVLALLARASLTMIESDSSVAIQPA